MSALYLLQCILRDLLVELSNLKQPFPRHYSIINIRLQITILLNYHLTNLMYVTINVKRRRSVKHFIEDIDQSYAFNINCYKTIDFSVCFQFLFDKQGQTIPIFKRIIRFHPECWLDTRVERTFPFDGIHGRNQSVVMLRTITPS